MRKRSATSSFLRTQEPITISGDKQRHVIAFNHAVKFQYFDIRDFVACDGIAKLGKKGEEVVWGISFKGTQSQLSRVRRELVRQRIEYALISSAHSPSYAKIWRQHSCMHGLLKDLVMFHNEQQAALSVA